MLYDDSFYQWQMDGSYQSALKYRDFLLKFFSPNSIVDIGCGRGMWLKAFKEKGISKLVGYDGEWNDAEKIGDPDIQFFPSDLNTFSPNPEERFDLAISLEVIEHLEERSGRSFIQALVSLSDVILFSGAYSNQGGVNHINEKPHSYWAEAFINLDYFPYDLFRPVFWGNDTIEWWYRQNAFLYVKKGNPLNQVLNDKGFSPIENIYFMNCIHPILYNSKL